MLCVLVKGYVLRGDKYAYRLCIDRVNSLNAVSKIWSIRNMSSEINVNFLQLM